MATNKIYPVAPQSQATEKAQSTIDTLKAKKANKALTGYELSRLISALNKVESRSASRVFKDVVLNPAESLAVYLDELASGAKPTQKTFFANLPKCWVSLADMPDVPDNDDKYEYRTVTDKDGNKVRQVRCQKSGYSLWDGLAVLRNLNKSAQQAAKVAKQGGKVGKAAEKEAKATTTRRKKATTKASDKAQAA